MSQIIGGIQLFTFFANVVLGALVLAKNPRSDVHRSFAFFAFGTSGWIITLYLMIFARYGDVLFVGRLAFLFFSVMLASVLWFTSVFPERSKRMRFAHIVSLVLGVGFAALSMSPFMIRTAEIRQTEGFGYIFGTFGPSYLAWLVFYFFTLFYTFFRAFRGMKKSSGLVRRQYRLLVAGMSLLYATMLTTQIILPFLGDFRWNSLGPIFTIFLIGAIAQSMLSYRMFDIRWIIKWGLVFPVIIVFTLGFIVYAIFLLSSLFSPSIASIISAFIIAFAFPSLYRGVSRLVSRLVGRGSYSFDDAVYQISQLAQRHLDMDRFQIELLVRIKQLFVFRGVVIAAFAPGKTTVLASQIDGFPRRILQEIPSVIERAASYGYGIVEADELMWRLQQRTDPAHAARDQDMLHAFRRWGIAAIVPLVIHGIPVGLFIFGEKKSGEPIFKFDWDLLNVIRGVCAPALANAARFLEMQKLYERLKELDKAKSDFIRVVSHQFRTPLTAIRWNAELILENKKVQRDVHGAINTIHDRTLYLTTTLDRIFDVLALESEALRFACKPVALDAFIRSLLPPYERIARTKRIRIATHLPPLVAEADAERLSIAVRALLDNAVAYTPRNGQVAIDIAEQRNGKREAVITVSDTGIGIAADELPHVFEKFYRGKGATSILPDGVGVGLFVVKAFIERMRGRIAVDSRIGDGTRFIVTLPLAKAASKKERREAPFSP